MTYHRWELHPSEIRNIQFDSLYYNKELPQELIKTKYLEWVNKDDYSLLYHKPDARLYAALQPKRGNKAYARNNQTKNEKVLANFFNSTHDSLSFIYPEDEEQAGSAVLFLTGVFNPHEVSKAEAWKLCKNWKEYGGKIESSAIHLFRANMRNYLARYWKDKGIKKEFIDKDSLMVSQVNIESHSSGYPHIHMVVIMDRLIPCYLHKHKRGSLKGRSTWRVQDQRFVRDIQRIWSRCVHTGGNSFMEVQAAVGDRIIDHDGNETSALAYCLKYSTKSLSKLSANEKDVLTHAYLKFWGARSIIGKKFLERLNALPIKDSRHDELTNELKTTKRTLEVIGQKFERLNNELGVFVDYCSSEEAQFVRDYPRIVEALERYMRDIKQELEEMCEWKYLWTVSFLPNDDQKPFHDAIRLHNEMIEEAKKVLEIVEKVDFE